MQHSQHDITNLEQRNHVLSNSSSLSGLGVPAAEDQHQYTGNSPCMDGGSLLQRSNPHGKRRDSDLGREMFESTRLLSRVEAICQEHQPSSRPTWESGHRLEREQYITTCLHTSPEAVVRQDCDSVSVAQDSTPGTVSHSLRLHRTQG